MHICQTSSNYHSYGADNQNIQELHGCLEARIEAVKRRVAELERENEVLRWTLASAGSIEVDFPMKS